MCWEELIRENAFGLGGNRDHLSACLAHMLYCIVAEKQYTLAYFVAKRIEHVRSNPKANLPYEIQDEDTSRASTPSPTTYLNSLSPIRPQLFSNPGSSDQNTTTLFTRQTHLLNLQEQMHVEKRDAFKSFAKAFKGAFTRKKK
ncbi:hypothetical protein Tco_0133126 [Tanacetum coccineum]